MMDFIHSMNIGLYKMGVLDSESHLTPIAIFMFLVTVALMINYQLRYMRNSPSKRVQDNNYFSTWLIISLSILLIALKAYTALLVAFLLISFYLIVLNNKKFKDIKSKFDKFF